MIARTPCCRGFDFSLLNDSVIGLILFVFLFVQSVSESVRSLVGGLTQLSCCLHVGILSALVWAWAKALFSGITGLLLCCVPSPPAPTSTVLSE